ncbi:MAG: RNA polymerase sigma factor [Candidatus Yanofskybacteria bacterium]|nr:RNA polymerase sigma factor [Candidatus Yanofskybacteria bacterium]
MDRPTEQQLTSAYDEHGDAIFRFCYAHTGDRERALDLTQETFVRVWRALSGGTVIERIRPFLYTTARHACIDAARRPATESLERLQEDGFDVADEQTLDPLLSTEVARVIRCIARLDEPYREAVALRYVSDLMPREIAEVIGESENVISVRITRGLQKLRELLHL